MAEDEMQASGSGRPQARLTPLTIRGRIARAQPKGLPIINLSFNESPFGPSPTVARAIENAAKNANRYGDPSCEPLRQALSRQNDIDPDRIICSNGSEEILDIIGRVFAEPGDEILISQYGYIQFSIVANRVGAKLVRAPEPAYATDPDALLAAVSERTKVVFLANPNNPTGTMIPIAELERLARSLPSSAVFVIDIAYGEFVDEGYCAKVHALAERFENIVVTRTFSKAFGLAGLRVGWCHAPGWMVPLIYAGRAMGPVNALAQAAALAALDDIEIAQNNTGFIVSERNRIAAALEEIGVKVLQSDTNFLLALPPGEVNISDRLVEYLFDEAGILVNRTREAGLERFFRFSLSMTEHNDSLVTHLAAAIVRCGH